MKNLILSISTVLISQSVFAVTQIACWDIYSKKGSRPVVTAEITEQDSLIVTLNTADERFQADYVMNKEITNHAGEKGTHTSVIQSDLGEVEASEVSPRSSYAGNIEYVLHFGVEEYKSSWHNYRNELVGRWILPRDLSPEALKNFRFKNRPHSERANSVMVLPPPVEGSQAGDNFLRMFCTSK